MRKNLKNNAENVWRLCFIALLLHPHSRENGDTEIMKQIFLEKSSEIIWRLKKSPYLCSRNRETIAREFFERFT